MPVFLRTAICLLLLSQLASCVIFNQGRNSPSPFSGNQSDDITPLELALSKYPVVDNEKHNTLYATVINYKQKRIASIELTRDRVSYLMYGDSLNFNIKIWDFDKTEELSTVITIPLYLARNLNFQKLTGNNFKITARERFDSSQSCLLRNPKIQADRSELFYIHTGQLINTLGSEVNFWAQTDVAATKVIYTAIIIATNSMDKVKYVKDLCKYRIDEANEKSQCPQPTLYVTYYSRPLAEIFDSKIWADFYRDCTVKIDCTKKK